MEVSKSRTLLLPPFITKTQVIEQNAVGVKTFSVGSKYGNQLRREVQHLTELHFLLPDLFLGRLTLGDVDHSTDEFMQIAGSVEDRTAYDVNVPDSFVRMHDSVTQFKIRLVADRFLETFPA